jgi:glycosyltransferase involved in cell wall biosynthesis
MRVVHFSTLHAARDVRIFLKECRTLAAAGHEVHLLAGDEPPATVDGVHLAPVRRPGTRFRPARIVARLHAVFCQAAALRADVYHFHDPELIPVGLMLRRRCPGARIVYDVHEDSPREVRALHLERPLRGLTLSWSWSLLESLARQAFDAFVCATDAIARKFPSRRTVLVRNFPQPEELLGLEAAVRATPAQVVYLGSIAHLRGARTMIEAVGLLPASLPARLQLAGTIYPPPLAGELRALPGWQRVDFHGVVDRAGVCRLLGRARAGLLVLPPLRIFRESLPVKLFEYMVAGLPVVASDFPLWRQILGEGGLYVDPQRPAAIAAALRHLLEHPAEAAERGRLGREAVLSRYHWGTEEQKLLTLYRDLEQAGENGSRRRAA